MLEMWLLPQLRESGLKEDMLLQDDAAPADFICSMYFSLFFRGCDQIFLDFEYDKVHE
jgi:hypothetical protein